MISNQTKKDPHKCFCPYCDEELKLSCFEPVFCKPCGVKFVKCKKCGGMVSEKLKKCSKCGQDI